MKSWILSLIALSLIATVSLAQTTKGASIKNGKPAATKNQFVVRQAKAPVASNEKNNAEKRNKAKELRLDKVAANPGVDENDLRAKLRRKPTGKRPSATVLVKKPQGGNQ